MSTNCSIVSGMTYSAGGQQVSNATKQLAPLDAICASHRNAVFATSMELYNSVIFCSNDYKLSCKS